MWTELSLLFSPVGQLLVQIIELTLNILNILNINEMIKDPERGYGKEYIYEAFSERLDPWIPLVTPPTGKYLTNSLILSTLSLHV